MYVCSTLHTFILATSYKCAWAIRLLDGYRSESQTSLTCDALLCVLFTIMVIYLTTPQFVKLRGKGASMLKAN